MRYRKLGCSDLEVSELSLGSWLTFAGGVSAEQTRACTEAAFDVGINFSDTANVYGQGAAESAWGDILSKHPRDSYVLANYVDLYQAHRFDVTVPIDDTIEGFQQVVQQGKARYLGFSEWTPQQIQAAIDIAGPALFVSSQPQYSMLWQAPEAEVFPLCSANNISQIVWSPLAQGVLTGKYKPGQPLPTDSRFASDAMNFAQHIVYNDEALEAVQRLVPVARSADLSLPTLALAWVLRRGEVASAITGASRPEQVHANAQASGVELTGDVLAAIDAALGNAPVKAPTLALFAQEGVLHRCGFISC